LRVDVKVARTLDSRGEELGEGIVVRTRFCLPGKACLRCPSRWGDEDVIERVLC
jgi:hypothetical protein